MSAHVHSALSAVVASEASLSRLMDRAVVLLAIALGGLALLTLLLGASETALFNVVADRALAQARQAPAWQILGESVQTGQPTGVVTAREPQQMVEVVVPVRGNRGRGKLYATAAIERGEPRLMTLKVTVGKDQLAVPLAATEEDGGARDADRQ